MLIREILPRRQGVIAAQHEPLPGRRLDEPVPVPLRGILEGDDPSRPQAEQVKDLVREAGRRSGHLRIVQLLPESLLVR